jgi:hypothetical protein
MGCNELYAELSRYFPAGIPKSIQNQVDVLCRQVDSVGVYMTYNDESKLGVCGRGDRPCYSGFDAGGG